MIQLVNNSNDPYFNLALEEYTVKNMSETEDYFILWVNRPTVVVGRNQNTIEEINRKFIEDNKIEVVRRMSGGGAVYHDWGNLNFTFVVNEASNFANFGVFTRPVISALDKIGIQAQNTGRNDITIDGKKFSGNAQFKHHNRLMHHGTILFDSNIENMVQALTPGAEKISSKGVKSVRSRVTNISDHLSSPISLEEFKQVLTETVLEEDKNGSLCELSKEVVQKVSELRKNKYKTWEWVYGHSPAYNIQQKGSFPWGNLDVRLDIQKGLIKGCRIYGDYFAARDISDIEQALTGTIYRLEAVKEKLSQINLQSYLPAAETSEIAELICG